MPVIICPSCKGKLRMPDNLEPRRVKCPSCNFTFLSSEAEVEGASSKSRKTTALGAEKTPKAKADDFEVVDDVAEEKPRRRREDEEEEIRPRSRRRDDDDDDRPRSKRRDDDDDRPRSKRRDDDDDDRPSRRGKAVRRDDDDDDDRPSRLGKAVRRDDDDDDDRPRSRRRDDDDDDDDRPSRRGKAVRRDRDDRDAADKKREIAGKLGWVRVGLQLQAIGAWCQAGAVGLLTLLAILLIARIRSLSLYETIGTIAGILSLGWLVVSIVGCVFNVLGPKKNGSMGMAIASLSLASVHLLLVIILIGQSQGLRAGLPVGGFAGSASLVPVLSTLLMFMFSGGGIPGEALLVILTPLVEIAKMVLFGLFLKSTAKTTKDREGQSVAGNFVMFWSIGTGAVVGGGLLLILLLRAIGSVSLAQTLGTIMLIVSFGTIAGLYAWYGFVATNVRDGIRSR